MIAAFLGATLDNSTGGVWFHPAKVIPIDELHFEYDPNNIWLNRIKDIYYEGLARWKGQVLMGMPDLGGVMDILSTFRPSEKTLDNTLYHLDGIGELNHLDSILSIKELDAVQWVPGDGNPPQEEWPDVLLKIHNAGKNLQLFGGLEALAKVEKILGTSKGIHLLPITGPISQKPDYMAALAKYHVI